MNKIAFAVLAAFMLSACNSVYVKPRTLDKNEVVFANRGGYSMRRSIKERMEERGYTVLVGKAVSSRAVDSDGDNLEGIDIDVSRIPANARYIVHVRERKESLSWYWCPFNGFWWWNFNVSIADQKTGEEILSWRGRGCANSSMRRLDDILDKLERK